MKCIIKYKKLALAAYELYTRKSGASLEQTDQKVGTETRSTETMLGSAEMYAE